MSHRLDDWQSDDIFALAEAIGRHRGDYQRGWGSIATNAGSEEYANEVFQMRTFCWCDSDIPGHEEDCPPNFHHLPSDTRVSWYKHAGRGAQINQSISEDRWRQIVAECRASVPISDDELRAARHRDNTVCEDCSRSTDDPGHALTPADAQSIRTGGRCVVCQRRGWDEMERLMGQGHGGIAEA